MSFLDRLTIRRFHRLFYRGREGRKPWQRPRWMGVQALKCPLDLWVYQEILFATRPELIVETGVHAGGTTLFLAQMLDLLDAVSVGDGGDGGSAEAAIVAVDITLEHLAPAARAHRRCTFLEGSSTDSAIAAEIARRAAGKRTMVILDSDHAADHVRRELELYAPLVSSGCYLIVEDTNVHGHPVFRAHGPGPWEAVHGFLDDPAQKPLWQIDRDAERYLLTFNPRGFLVRR